MNARIRKFGLALAGTLAVVGCDQGDSTKQPAVSRIPATVTGKVIAGGGPVPRGKVTVNAPGPPYVESIADIRKDGTYEVKTFAGKNAFTVTGTGFPPKPGKYDKANFDVKEGANTIDLTLPLSDQ